MRQLPDGKFPSLKMFKGIGVAWGGAFKTLRGLDGRAESVQGWIHSVS